VALYSLDERSGDVAADSIGHHDGAFLNGVKLGLPGAVRNSLAPRFRAKRSNHVLVANDRSFQLSEATVGFAFRADAMEGFQGLLGKDVAGQGTAGDLSIYLQEDKVVARFQSTGRGVS